MNTHLSTATAADIPACARLIATAFHDDPVVFETFPGADNRLARLTKLFTMTLREIVQSHGVIDIARRDHDGMIIGVAAWHGPHKSTVLDFLRNLLTLPSYIQTIGVRRLPTTLRTLSSFRATKPKTAHWYLADIAVSDDARNLGVGSQLLEYRLGVIDRTRLPAYLEATTPASEQLYERFGFNVISRINITSNPAAMLRPAA
jgi:ribosomal protein S18 acetylase RimI-like enzyme